MAELLVRTVDKETSGNPYEDRHRSSRGCVIAIMPDGHPWSEAERTAPFWRIVKLPGVTPALLTQLTSSDLGYGRPEAEKLNRVMRRWTHRIDLDALDQLLANPTIRTEIQTSPAKALSRVLALRVAQPTLNDSAAAGGPRKLVRVIG